MRATNASRTLTTTACTLHQLAHPSANLFEPPLAKGLLLPRTPRTEWLARSCVVRGRRHRYTTSTHVFVLALLFCPHVWGSLLMHTGHTGQVQVHVPAWSSRHRTRVLPRTCICTVPIVHCAHAGPVRTKHCPVCGITHFSVRAVDSKLAS